MISQTQAGLVVLLMLSGACQPRPRESGMADTAAGSRTSAAALSSADESNIRAVDAAWAKAATAGDGKGLVALYTADATLLPPGEPMVKGEAVGKYWTDFASGYSGQVELNTVSVEGGGDIAYAVGTYRMALTPKKAGAKPLPIEEGKYIEVLKRQDDGSWKIEHDIWNTNVPPGKP